MVQISCEMTFDHQLVNWYKCLVVFNRFVSLIDFSISCVVVSGQPVNHCSSALCKESGVDDCCAKLRDKLHLKLHLRKFKQVSGSRKVVVFSECLVGSPRY